MAALGIGHTPMLDLSHLVIRGQANALAVSATGRSATVSHDRGICMPENRHADSPMADSSGSPGAIW
jgi:hypothetical protein